MRSVRTLAAAVLCLLAALGPSLAAEKQGGILRMYHRDSPASASIHEDATYSVNVPFMPVFNNLVIYDQNDRAKQHGHDRPDLADSWAWSSDNKTLTFKLHPGVKWHDGKPFTSADVKCTFDMLMGKSPQKFRKNPRKSWYDQVDDVTTNGDYEATFHLKRPQPALLAMLASGYTPVYPCHVSPAEMRTHPIGTGPFKFVEFKPNEFIKLVRNPDYWKKGLPYLDGIEFTIIPNRSTAILGFVAGKFDMTFPTEVTIPLLKDVKSQEPNAVCVVAPNNVSTNIIINRARRRSTISTSAARWRWRSTARRSSRSCSRARAISAARCCRRRTACGAMPEEMLETIPGYGPTSKANREEARKLMQKAGYGPDKQLQIKVSTRNIAVYRDPAVILIDQLKNIYIDAELDVVETAQLVRQDRAQGLCGRPQPDRRRRRRSRPVVLRKLLLRLGAQLHQLLQQGHREAVRPAIGGNRRREAQEAGVGDRQEAAGGRGAPDHLPRPHGHLLAALREGRHRHDEQLLQRLSLRGRVAGQVARRAGGQTLPARSKWEAPGVCLSRAAPRA